MCRNLYVIIVYLFFKAICHLHETMCVNFALSTEGNKGIVITALHASSCLTGQLLMPENGHDIKCRSVRWLEATLECL